VTRSQLNFLCIFCFKFRQNRPESAGEMRAERWLAALLLTVGSAGFCCAGPLHAQCQVEWYVGFILNFDRRCDVFDLNSKTIILHNSQNVEGFMKQPFINV